MIGAPGQVFGDSAGAGRVVIFRRTGDAWTKEATLAAGNADRVIVSNDGAGARALVGSKTSPVRWFVMGIVDR